MKNIKLTSLLLSAMIAISPTANANPFGAISYIKVVEQDNGSKNIAVHIPYSNAPKVMVKLEDSKGFSLFSKYVKGEKGFAKMLNVNSLPNGVYFITVEDDEKIAKQAFRIESDAVILKEYKKEITKKPNLQYNSHKQMVLLDIAAEGAIEVEMQTEYGDSLLKKSGMNDFKQAFDLKHLEQGSYTFIIQYNDTIFYKSVHVQ